VRIRAALDDQTAAWNRGSIDGFMEHYVRGPELTFSSGGQVQRGWETTRERFAARYPDRAAMGTLSFSDLETQLLGRDHALTLGRWRLKRAGGQLGGAFSLVWRRDGRHWRILHDHTTQDTPPP
jgi:ketosteroid isomerase-like protein